jgi:hypothetical protein
MACKIFPLAASFGFKSVPLGTTPILRVETPLPLFAIGIIATEHTDHFLAEVETETKKVLGSFGLREYVALRLVNIPNGDHLNAFLSKWGFRTLLILSLAPRFHSQPTGSGRPRWQRSWPLKRQRLVRAGPPCPEWCHLRLKQDRLRRSVR